MITKFLLAAILAATALPALAQETPSTSTREVRCLIGGRAFSPGATAKAADKVELCDAAGKWVETDKGASGCFLADRFYSVGAATGGDNGKGGSVCVADGTWKAATP